VTLRHRKIEVEPTDQRQTVSCNSGITVSQFSGLPLSDAVLAACEKQECAQFQRRSAVRKYCRSKSELASLWRNRYREEVTDLAQLLANEVITQPHPALSVSDARIAYGSVQALQGVSVDLHRGEILGLLGPNGAGKTSLLQCLANRRKLDSGEIRCSLKGDYESLIGVVPQEIAVYHDLSVEQNLSVFARFQGIEKSEIRAVVDEAIEWAQLSDKRRALAGGLSGGMQRRLNIASSVMHRPQILLLDEPTVGVDPQSRERIYEMLTSLLDSGTAILLTTHHLEEAQDRCDRIAIIDQGRIVDCGSFEELLSRTIGTTQYVRVQFASPQSRVPAPLQLTKSRLEATCPIEDVAIQLPSLLTRIRAARLPLEDLSLRSPTLQHLFLHLTGKELRE
jgi:ABC-2 type transport system ATP-binding protein